MLWYNRWLQGDALNLPFANEVFDAVTVGYGLRNVTNIPQALNEIFRVVKKGYEMFNSCFQSEILKKQLSIF